MSSHAQDQVAKDLVPMEVSFPNGRFTVTATCDDCTKQTVWSSLKMTAANIVRKKIQSRHWLLNDKEQVCAVCAEKRREVRRAQRYAGPVTETPFIPPTAEENIMQKSDLLSSSAIGDRGVLVPTEEQIDDTPARTVPTDAARAQKRAAYELLLEHYDTVKRRYHADWSDQVISDKTGYHVHAVGRLRDEDFGPAGPPPQMLHVKGELTKLSQRIQAIETKISQEMDELGKLQEMYSKLAADFDRLVAVHGWEAA